MVAKIKSGKSLKGALNYNENKVKQGKATLIHAAGYLKEPADMNFYDKLNRLTDLAARNQRTKTNTVHISLNFAGGEKLPTESLEQISDDYMKGIGFENQPYLVYRHSDAGHPHIHIVSTNIKPNGERISLHYLGQNQSEKTRQQIEIRYGLIKAQEQQQKPEKAKAIKREYGQAETKRQITNVVSQLIREYKFSSIPEFNAVLKDYNILADTLQKQNIAVIFRQNAEGRIYGLTFIDHRNKTVFNGSDLGKAYSANEMNARFATQPGAETDQHISTPPAAQTTEAKGDSLIDILFHPEQQDLAALNKIKKKKRQRQNL